MDKYSLKMLSIIDSYERSRGTGIGITVLDRKFYEAFSYDEAMISSIIEKLKKDGLLLDVYPLSTHTEHTENFETYFCTLVCYRWLRLFEITNFYDQVYNRFDHLKSKGCYIPGDVIMPNYLHALHRKRKDVD